MTEARSGASARAPVRRAPVSPARLASARDLWECGAAVRRVAEVLGRSENATREMAVRLGWSSPSLREGVPPPISAEGLDAARRAWERGDATASVAALLSRAENTTREIAAREGWSRPEGWLERMHATCRWSPSSEAIERLRVMWLSGARDWEMADEFRVSWHAIAAMAERIGLPGRDRAATNEQRRRDGIGRLGLGRRRLHLAARLFDEGAASEVIAERCGVALGTVGSLIADARRLGLVEKFSARSWRPTDEDVAVIADGLRLGVFADTVGWLIAPRNPIPGGAIRAFATKRQIRARNRVRLLRYLAPEQLWAAERSGIDPVARVLHLFTHTQRLDAGQASGALNDYVEALDRFPALIDRTVPLRTVPYSERVRDPPGDLLAVIGRFRWAPPPEAPSESRPAVSSAAVEAAFS